MTIYLVRHAKTDWNDLGLWQGTSDVPLNEEGIKQAEKLAKRFSKLPIEAVFTSPLKRSYQTAKIIASEKGLQPIVDELLIECRIDLWNGLTMEETLKRFKKEHDEWSKNPDAQINGVESLSSVKARMIKFFQQIVAKDFNQVVVVSHAIALRMLISWILGLEIPNHVNFKLENASITAVQVASKPRILYLNDMCHLESD
ncbi:histidine phosphatase family protein [Pseudothermotoga thermarum]|uniref:Phosphoglycerate mutase n=1 Tax=Pseudothermotoga thermarum DSM 5069 TaxID=688269 RepID=F7YWE2_9THEM|nr:histidine phosphatase family protein [Pseudothermotoga thermarum]AEH51920.1 Phosphoglycerate mutase [Pseudothermotoga thermarum DSM 5069]